MDDRYQSVVTRPGRTASSAFNRSQTNASIASDAVGLYATPSYGALYVEPEDLEPGPGTYNHPQGLGFQQLSTKLSEPHASLTAKHDKSWEKVMITKDHLSVLIGRGTPGPGSYEPEAVKTQARVRFGTNKRQANHDTDFRAPGPVYEVTGDPENVPHRVKFGKEHRFARDGLSLAKSLGSCGPGQYESATQFDGTNLAKSFGASHRAYDKVRFPGSERMEIGRASTGPGAATPFQNTGRTSSFGRAERLPGIADQGGPGPGKYDNHQKPSPFSRSMSVYSFGRPHPRGRIDYKQMRTMGNSMWGVH